MKNEFRKETGFVTFADAEKTMTDAKNTAEDDFKRFICDLSLLAVKNKKEFVIGLYSPETKTACESLFVNDGCFAQLMAQIIVTYSESHNEKKEVVWLKIGSCLSKVISDLIEKAKGVK